MMESHNWFAVAAILIGVSLGWGLAFLHAGDYAKGYAAGVASERVRTEQARQDVRLDRKECNQRVLRTHAEMSAIYDHARVVWETNSAAMRRDMAAYEDDLERCRHVRTR